MTILFVSNIVHAKNVILHDFSNGEVHTFDKISNKIFYSIKTKN